MQKVISLFAAVLLIFLFFTVQIQPQVAETVETNPSGEKINKTPLNLQPQIPTYSLELFELYDNGPFVTNPGGGPGGADGSVLQNTTLGLNVLGFNWSKSVSIYIADNFIVPNGANWTIDSLRFYGYQTGSSTTSTFNSLYITIFKGNPAYGLTPVFGDTITNRFIRSYWTGAYRYAENSVGTTRPIMAVVGSIPGLTLSAGEYWVMVSASGTLSSGPWMPPVSVLGQPSTGNALQFIGGSGWQQLIDNGIFTNQGIPFKIFGTTTVPTGPGAASNPSPYDLSTVATAPNLTLSWTNPSGADECEVYFGTDPDSLNLIHTGSLISSKAVTGLLPNTFYFWRVDEINTSGITLGTLWAFQTLCDVQPVPYSQNFDGAFFPPSCWTRLKGATGNNWFLTTTNPYSGTGAMIYPFNPVESADAWMITPGLTLTGGTQYTIRFFQRVQSATLPEKLKVTVGTFPDIASQTTVLWSSDSLVNTTYSERLVTFTPSSSGTYYFGFNAYSDADRFYLYVDEVSIYQTPSNDIGALSLSQNFGASRGEKVEITGLSRELEKELKSNLENANEIKPTHIQIQLFEPDNSNVTEVTPPVFKVIVKNFGNVTENSYQVGWAVDGVVQTPVSNTQPLAPLASDTLTLTWSSATAGLHTARAWTILATDLNPTNDSSNTVSFYVAPDNSIFLERFEGSFPPAGWDTVNVDDGGTVPTWFVGNPLVFPALEGNGYAASNYQGANGFYIDQWLITPNTGGFVEGTSTDSLIFWMRSPQGSIWPDSVQILVSTTGNTIGDFTTVLDSIEADTSGNWIRYSYALPNSANRYIAFRYLHYDGGPSGNSSNYVGIDLVEIQRFTSSSTFQLTVNVDNGWNLVSV
ncbi:choice-of-anchor J domain-containing protein, partial [Ignavibacterium sp.]|uniref:choice-of-anchor J domain-containing protein n=1 Tax=Ignavibacterium sp. TaxID=2651167 RepID=UPI00307EB852